MTKTIEMITDIAIDNQGELVITKEVVLRWNSDKGAYVRTDLPEEEG